MSEILEYLKPVVDNPVEDIIKQIRYFVNTGILRPGDKLPAERKMAEKFQVGRSTVRTAIKRLEFYQVIKTLPQSGSLITGIEHRLLEVLLTGYWKWTIVISFH